LIFCAAHSFGFLVFHINIFKNDIFVNAHQFQKPVLFHNIADEEDIPDKFDSRTQWSEFPTIQEIRDHADHAGLLVLSKQCQIAFPFIQMPQFMLTFRLMISSLVVTLAVLVVTVDSQE
jgi:hypothetical protein